MGAAPINGVEPMQWPEIAGERGRNRTYNLLIKSQLLCQLSYAPFWVGPSGMEIFWRGSAKSRLIHCILTPIFKQAGCKQVVAGLTPLDQ